MTISRSHNLSRSPVVCPVPTMGRSYARSLAVAALCITAVWILARPSIVLAQDTNRPARTELSSFKIIEDRNIFNANRSGRQNRANPDARKPVKIDIFKLVGSMTYDNGSHAFFDGSSSAYRKAIKANEKIAGFKVCGITLSSVQLEDGDKRIELRIGSEMRREDEGEWKLIAASASTSSFDSSSSATASDSTNAGSGGEASDILKRLMQQREQELK